MSTRSISISTRHEHDVCDVCERTLLRGERSEVFINAGRRYSVCELCKPRALHEGWMREGVLGEHAAKRTPAEHRGVLLGRWRGRRPRETGAGGGRPQGAPPQAPPRTLDARTLDDELSAGVWPDHAQRPATASSRRRGQAQGSPREPRHVHAIPASGDHKVAAALEAFNHSEHRRTVAGVARSLGVPSVNVTPDDGQPSLVWIIVAWELCWYRYEVDLAVSRGGVRLGGQGYELEELQTHERTGNAVAAQDGALSLA
ncbi:MAG: hypothetical protein ACRDKL_12085 [Solirubrobacteraceae bacterium]